MTNETQIQMIITPLENIEEIRALEHLEVIASNLGNVLYYNPKGIRNDLEEHLFILRRKKNIPFGEEGIISYIEVREQDLELTKGNIQFTEGKYGETKIRHLDGQDYRDLNRILECGGL